MSSLRIRAIGRDQDAAWDSFVEPRSSTVVDLSGWARVVLAVYGMQRFAFAALDGERWVGALAVFEVRHPLFGHYLVSAPFGTDGGLYADDDDVRAALCEHAAALAADRRASYLLIRTRDRPLADFVADQRYVTALKPIAGDEDRLWHEGFGFKTRNHIRKGQQGGFELRWGHDQLEPFCDVFGRHMRDLGSPAHGRRFYQAIIDQLPEQTRLLVAYHEGRPAAGALIFHVNGTAANLHTVALRKYNRGRVNYLVYWEMLRRAQQAGCHTFDMGRTLDPSTNLDFKRNWRPQIVRLHYNYRLLRLEQPPFVDPRNPRYRLAIAGWRRLPLPFTRWLGPSLIRGLA